MANETEIALRQDLNLIMRKSGAAIIITDQGSYDHAALLLVKMIQPFRKRWKEYWQGPIQAAHQAHKVVLAKFNEGDEPAKKAEEMIKHEIRAWDIRQEELRQERQRAEQRAVEEREARERAVQAAFAEEEGAPPAEIEAIVSAPSIAVAEPVPETYQKVTGISRRDNYKCRVVDIKNCVRRLQKGRFRLIMSCPTSKY